jgi:hypothetical protein
MSDLNPLLSIALRLSDDGHLVTRLQVGPCFVTCDAEQAVEVAHQIQRAAGLSDAWMHVKQWLEQTSDLVIDRREALESFTRHCRHLMEGPLEEAIDEAEPQP